MKQGFYPLFTFSRSIQENDLWKGKMTRILSWSCLEEACKRSLTKDRNDNTRQKSFSEHALNTYMLRISFIMVRNTTRIFFFSDQVLNKNPFKNLISCERNCAVTPCILSWESDGGPEKGPFQGHHLSQERICGVPANPHSHLSSPWKPSKTFTLTRSIQDLHFYPVPVENGLICTENRLDFDFWSCFKSMQQGSD